MLILLVLWPIAELFVVLEVADAVGWLETLALLVAGVPLGVFVLRSHGLAAWRRTRLALAAGRSPGREIIDGALVMLAGAMLVVPGFIGDALGILLLLPPTRALLRRAARRSLEGRFVTRVASFRRPPGERYDVDSTAVDVAPPHRHP